MSDARTGRRLGLFHFAHLAHCPKIGNCPYFLGWIGRSKSPRSELRGFPVAAGLVVVGVLVLAGGGWGRELGPTETVHPADSTGSLLTGQRVTQVFDFEEREVHLEPLPMYWGQVAAGSGFPHYAQGRLDTEFARSGRYSFGLISDGGSVGFRYHPRRIPVRPGSDFQVTGYVHLERAEHCRARLSCTFATRRGELIPESTRFSAPVGMAEQDGQGWARLEVHLPGDYPGAQYLTVGVWLEQERQWNRAVQLEGGIFRTDVEARAWFDDVAIYQLPRVRLTTGQVGNAFGPGEPVRLGVEVEHVSALEYQMRLGVTGADGRSVHEESWLLTGISDGPRLREVELKGLAAGIYEARLEILSSGRTVAQRRVRFARLGELSGEAATSGGGFGVVALDAGAGDWASVERLTRLANAKVLKLPVWREGGDSGAIFSMGDFDEKLLRLQQGNVQVMAVFSEPPAGLAGRTAYGQTGVLDVLSKESELWRRPLASVLAQYARQVPYWQVGPEATGLESGWDQRVPGVVARVGEEFAQLASDAMLAAPVNALYEVDRAALGTGHAALAVPAAVAPDQIPGYIAECRGRGMERVWATIEPLEEELYERRARLGDFAMRLAYARRGGADAIFVEHPWRGRQGDEGMVEPTELLCVVRTMADHLGGRQYGGQFTAATGVEAMVFGREGRGCLVMWRQRTGQAGPVVGDVEATGPVEIYLGADAVAVDVWGNREAVRTRNGAGLVELGELPVIVEGVDTRLAALRATLRLAPAVLDATMLEQETTLRLGNPFGSAISGQVRLVRSEAQANWQVAPQVVAFSLRPGEELSEPVVVRFPRNEVSGAKELRAVVAMDADRAYRFEQPLRFEIELEGVEMSVFAWRSGEEDMLLQQVVTNTTGAEVSLLGFVDLPNRERLERAIPQLAAGTTVTKRYLIAGAGAWKGQYLRVGLYDAAGTRRLNRLVEID